MVLENIAIYKLVSGTFLFIIIYLGVVTLLLLDVFCIILMDFISIKVSNVLMLMKFIKFISVTIFHSEFLVGLVFFVEFQRN